VIKLIQRLGLIFLCFGGGLISFALLMFHSLPYIGSERRFWNIAIGFNSAVNAVLGGCLVQAYAEHHQEKSIG